MHPQEALNRLTACLAKLPGVGKRTAERMAVKLVRDRERLLPELREALETAERELCCCRQCGSITARTADPCLLCTGATRDDSLLCVVEDPGDIALLERAGGFRGRYHALMGRISPLRGEGRGDLRIKALLERVGQGRFREIILAMNTDVEGDATASYLADTLRGEGLRVTRLAGGLPAGSGIGYADPVTLARALAGRREAESLAGPAAGADDGR
jgi:recombination protein RecR